MKTGTFGSVHDSSDGFVGRSQELWELLNAWQDVRKSKKPIFLFVQGEGGIGKSLLVEHFLNDIRNSKASPIICQVRCPLHDSKGFEPFREIFFSLYNQGLGLGLTKKQIWEFILEDAAAWAKILSSDPKFFLVDKVVQGARDINTYLDQKNLIFSQDSIAEQFCRFLSRILKKREMIIFIDDLHWADASSLSLLPIFQLHIKSGGLMLVGAHRPGKKLNVSEYEMFDTSLAQCLRYGARRIDMREGISVRSYVAKHYPGLFLSPGFIEQIQTRSDGLPFFIDRLFVSWENEKIIVSEQKQDGEIRWRLNWQESEIKIPVEIFDLIREQLSSITEELRNLLEIASVEGEDFTLQMLSRISSREIFRTMNELDALEKKFRMVKSAGNKEVGSLLFGFYNFWHAFVQEYLYREHLSETKRQQLHMMIGETLESLYIGLDMQPIAAQLARHFLEAKLSIKAAKYCLMAASYERSRFAWESSDRWCEEGIRLTKGLSGYEAGKILLDLLKISTENHNTWTNYSKAIEQMQLAVSKGVELKLPIVELARLQRDLADYLAVDGQYEKAKVVVLDARSLLAGTKTPPLLDIMLDVTWAHILTSDSITINDGIQLFENCIERARNLPPDSELTSLICLAYNSLGLAFRTIDRFEDAHNSYRRSYEMALSQGRVDIALYGMLNLAYSLIDIGELAESLNLTEKAIKIARQIASLDDEAYVYTIQGACAMQIGEYERAIDLQKKSIDIHSRLNSTWNYLYLHYDMAIAYIGLGKLDEAEAAARISQSFSVDEYEKSYSLESLARVQAAQRDWDEAEVNFQTVIQGFEKNGANWSAARARRFLGMMFAEKGDFIQARRFLLESLHEMDALDSDYEVQLLREILANIANKS